MVGAGPRVFAGLSAHSEHSRALGSQEVRSGADAAARLSPYLAAPHFSTHAGRLPLTSQPTSALWRCSANLDF